MAGLLLGLRRQLAGSRRKYRYGSEGTHRDVRAARPEPVRSSPQGEARSGGQRPEAGREEPGLELDVKEEDFSNHTCERTQDIVNKDDFLLQQIDEFRERAQQLQNLMNDREAELQRLEEERQQKQRLEQEQQKQRLEEERQQKRPEQVQVYPAERSEQSEEPADEAGTSPIGDQMQRIEQILLERDEAAGELTAEVERKIDEMIEQVGAKLSELDQSVRESVDGGNQAGAQRAKELKESLEQIRGQLEALKADLSDKVHSENVKCYRNIQELLKNMEKKLDELGVLGQKTGSVRTFMIAVLIFTVLNFVAVMAVMLMQLGVFAG